MLKYISNNKGLIKYLILGILVFLLLRQCNQTQKLKTQIKQVETVADRNYSNLLASQDSVQTFKNQRGDLISQISSFEFEVNNLSNENKRLLRSYQNVLSVNEKLKDINTTISTKLKISDSLINTQSEITYQNNDSLQIELNDYKKWDKYNWRQFDATIQLLKDDDQFKVSSSNIVLKQALSLKMAILKVDGRSKLRISTPNPDVEFTQIENINLVNDKLNPALQQSKNWGIGFGIQYGLNLNNKQVINTGPAIGIGIYYSPSWLRW
jgi:hypothetical protein